MSTSKIKPTGLTLDREKHTLHIAWHDGHESIFDLDALREACPCAVCRGGHHNMGLDHSPDILKLTPMRSYDVQDIQQIGNYALQFSWSDGHNSGIYTWEYLRHLDTPATSGPDDG